MMRKMREKNQERSTRWTSDIFIYGASVTNRPNKLRTTAHGHSLLIIIITNWDAQLKTRNINSHA